MSGGALRIVLAALLAAAVVGTALPVVETARVDHTAAAVDREADRLDRAALALVRTGEPTARGDARRTVTLRLPVRSWGHAGVGAVELADGRLRWRTPGGRWRERRLAAPLVVPVPIATAGSDRRLRVRLALVGADDGRAVVLVFKSDAAASRARESEPEPGSASLPARPPPGTERERSGV